MPANLHPYLAQVRQELEYSIQGMELREPQSCVHEMEATAIDEFVPIRPIVEFPHLGVVETRRMQHSAREYCLMESSKNSIRLSFAFKQQFSDAIDQTILEKYVRFFQQRAPVYEILRRKTPDFSEAVAGVPVVEPFKKNKAVSRHTHPVDADKIQQSSYSISFLITNKHVQKYGQAAVVATILDFVSQFDKECSHVKISTNALARSVATDFLKSF